MQSPHLKKFMANSKPPPPPPAYTYNMNGIPVQVPVSVPFTTISNAYINCVTDDQLQNGNGNGNGDRIENSCLNNNGDEVVSLDPETEEYFNSFPSGYRFCPTDVELINDYLKRKLDNVPLPRNKIHDANLYSLPQNYATPTATVATPVSSMPVYSETADADADADAAAAAIVPDNTASGDLLYSSSTQMLTDYEYDYYYDVDTKVFAGFDVNDFLLCHNFQYDDSGPSKRQKKD